jgi:hypothetical protein
MLTLQIGTRSFDVSASRVARARSECSSRLPHGGLTVSREPSAVGPSGSTYQHVASLLRFGAVGQRKARRDAVATLSENPAYGVRLSDQQSLDRPSKQDRAKRAI